MGVYMVKPKGRIQQPIDKDRKFVTVKLLTKTTDLLERIARVENITRSYLVSNIIDEYLKTYDIKLLDERERVKNTNL
jgi:CHASE3 domain sensor protein